MQRTIVILSASSDIGQALMVRYLDACATVVGTYRHEGSLTALRGRKGAHLVALDLDHPESFDGLTAYMR